MDILIILFLVMTIVPMMFGAFKAIIGLAKEFGWFNTILLVIFSIGFVGLVVFGEII